MATWLKQSTAVDVGLGPFVDQTDGFTAETALTIIQADVRLKKNAGAWAQKNSASSATHEENGWYEVPLDTTDTNTLGILLMAVNETGALPVWREFMVVPAEVYDTLVGGTDNLTVDLTSGALANVNTEVDVALATTTYAESGAVPAATASLKDSIVWLKTLARNKITQDSATQTLRNDGDTGSVATAAVSDSAGVFTRAKWA